MNTRFKAVRESAGLNMRDFASRIGVSHGTISLLENGRRNITEHMIKSVCREFSINETWLRTGDGDMHSPETRNQEIATITAQLIHEETAFRSQLIRLISDMDADDMEMLRKYAIKLGKIAEDSQ